MSVEMCWEEEGGTRAKELLEYGSEECQRLAHTSLRLIRLTKASHQHYAQAAPEKRYVHRNNILGLPRHVRAQRNAEQSLAAHCATVKTRSLGH